MKRIGIILLVLLTGCATQPEKTKVDIGQLRYVTKEKQINYLTCIKEASLIYSKSSSSAGEAAQATLSKCESQLSEVTTASFNQLHAVGKHDMTSLDIKMANEYSEKLKKDSYDNAVRYIIESRMKNQ
ncbi:hypothetical protein [Acinetobacter guerrae]|uniref:hypothetical protein n=1 Tax=Acinetobacter guerrae TaxID=1843371 RepID=UPI00128B00F4|nr:hypothetical protein [Acinetobacter guerrae]MPW44089.1 hypothetical protein [Acinetobacter guerrae]